MKKFFKNIFANKMSRVWFIVTACVLVFLLVVNIVANTALYEVLASVVGGKRAIYADGVEAIYESDYSSKQETLKKAKELNESICEEGFVLLKNDGALPIHTPESAGDGKTAAKPKISVFGKNSVNLAYGGSGSGASAGAGLKTV